MATKYVSALNGQQMDSALTDMAYHTSEAFAIGERNGVPVSSGDVAYHNNAKYYAEQASADATEADAAAARAEAAVPPSTAGAVFFDRAQALTDAQKEQAKANIGAGSTNRNLLDNAYFVGGGSQLGDGHFPINQREQTQYTAAGFVFDRWFKSGGITATLDAGGLTIVNSNGWPDGINQRFPMHFFAQMNGQAITASVLYADGSVDSGTAVIDATQNYQWLKYPEAGEIGFQLKNFQDGAAYDYFDYISFGAGANSTPKKIKAVKLELGTVSTLANDVPPNFAAEFEKCRYYLRYIPLTRYAIAIDGANAYMTMIGMPMRGVPTPSLVTAGGVRDAGGTSTITSATVTGFTYKIPTVQFALSASRSYVVGYIYDTVLCLSAEL